MIKQLLPKNFIDTGNQIQPGGNGDNKYNEGYLIYELQKANIVSLSVAFSLIFLIFKKILL